MPVLTVLPDIERGGGFDALKPIAPGDRERIIHLGDETRLEVGGLKSGMASGNPSVAFCFPLPDGRVVIAETSLALLLSAADALKAVHGDPRS
jgi:hypothetical protein